MTPVEFLSLARGEIGEANRYYNVQQAGLGARFVAEVRDVAKRIAK